MEKSIMDTIESNWCAIGRRTLPSPVRSPPASRRQVGPGEIIIIPLSRTPGNNISLRHVRCCRRWVDGPLSSTAPGLGERTGFRVLRTGGGERGRIRPPNGILGLLRMYMLMWDSYAHVPQHIHDHQQAGEDAAVLSARWQRCESVRGTHTQTPCRRTGCPVDERTNGLSIYLHALPWPLWARAGGRESI